METLGSCSLLSLFPGHLHFLFRVNDCHCSDECAVMTVEELECSSGAAHMPGVFLFTCLHTHMCAHTPFCLRILVSLTDYVVGRKPALKQRGHGNHISC